MLKTINYIFYILFISFMVGVAGLLIGSMLPIPGNIELKIVKSGSMEPTIPTGSLVVVKPSSNYGIGDVITFGADTKTEVPTTHRIIGFEADENGRGVYRTKGDANEDADANPVGRAEVIGKVVLYLPYVGFVLDFARQPLGFALLIGVPATLVILEEVMMITKEVKTALRRRRRKEEGEDADDEPLGGGTRFREITEPHKLVYLRKRAMDEIFVPMVVETRRWVKEKVPASKDAYASATFVVIGLVFVSTLLGGGAGSTVAYFNDIERSIGNLFAAASCDTFRVGSCDPVELLTTEEEPSLLSAFSADEQPEEEGVVLGAATSTPEAEPETAVQESEIPIEDLSEPEGESNLLYTNEAIPHSEEAPEEAVEVSAAEATPEPIPEPEPQPEPEPELTPEPQADLTLTAES